MSKNRSSSSSGFIGAGFRIGDTDEALEDLFNNNSMGRAVQHATKWKNRRPICPYGCDQEGELVEIVVKDGKALGIYRDSEQLKFTADLQMSPKPTGHKIQIGPDGEPMYVEDSGK